MSENTVEEIKQTLREGAKLTGEHIFRRDCETLINYIEQIETENAELRSRLADPLPHAIIEFPITMTNNEWERAKLEIAKANGVEIKSGMISGLGETTANVTARYEKLRAQLEGKKDEHL